VALWGELQQRRKTTPSARQCWGPAAKGQQAPPGCHNVSTDGQRVVRGRQQLQQHVQVLRQSAVAGLLQDALWAASWLPNTTSCCLISEGARLTLSLLLLPAASMCLHRGMLTWQTSRACCLASVGLSRMREPLTRGVARTWGWRGSTWAKATGEDGGVLLCCGFSWWGRARA
jgi:hypothetical protein